MRALAPLEKKNPGHGSSRSGAIRKVGIGNVISTEFLLSLSETYALKYWWCSPPRTGIASMRPTV
jgi:hypothetical protein